MPWDSGNREFVPLPMTRKKRRFVPVEPVDPSLARNRAAWFPEQDGLTGAPGAGVGGSIQPFGFEVPGGPGVVYAGYPLWYHGLVHESYVRIYTCLSGPHLPPSGPARVRVSFHSATGRYTSTTADVPVGNGLLNTKIPITNRYTYVMAQVIAMQKSLQAADPATRAMYAQKATALAAMPASMEQMGMWGEFGPPQGVGRYTALDEQVTELLVEPALTGPFPSNFAANYCRDIRIKNISQQPIPIRCIQIWINNVKVYELGSPTPGQPAQSLSSQETLNLSSSIHNYLMQQVDYVHNRNPILRCAALRIGESVRSEYDVPWLKVDDTDVFCHRSEHWCTEFDAWAIRKGTGGALDPTDDGERDCHSTDEMAMFFIPRGRFIAPRAYGPCPAYQYHELGQVVRPGYWVSVGQGGHSAMFVGWDGGFDPTAPRNRFRAISGNVQNAISVGTYTVANNVDLDEDVVFHPGVPLGENQSYVDGFGKTD